MSREPDAGVVHEDLDRLISGYLDESLAGPDVDSLAERLRTDPAAADRFARAALLHDRLRDLLTLTEVATDGAAALNQPAPGRMPVSRRLLAGAGAITLLTAWILIGLSGTGATAASAALDRLIARATAANVRQYRIRVVDGVVPAAAKAPAGRGRKPDVDGGTVTLCGGDAFVLVRRFVDGATFITGSDGSTSWSIPPHGPVHVSRDPRRFRRGLPGERDDIPFVSLPDGLRGLQHGYTLSLRGPTGGESSLLTAQLVSKRHRGPHRVRIWLTAEGDPIRIRLEGLPTDNGNPGDLDSGGRRTVELELVERPAVSPEFFSHAAHHGPDREVVEE